MSRNEDSSATKSNLLKSADVIRKRLSTTSVELWHIDIYCGITQLKAPSRKDGAQPECNPNMENLNPNTSTATVDTATETNDIVQDSPTAPEALSEQTSLPAGGLPDLAEAVSDGASAPPDEAALTSDIAAEADEEQGLRPSPDDAVAAPSAAEDATSIAVEESLTGVPETSIQAAAKGVVSPVEAPPRKRGRRPKERVLPDLPPRQFDPTVVDDCITKLMKLNGRDLYTDMERGHVLKTLAASCKDGAAFAQVVQARAHLSDKQAYNLINVTARFGSQVKRWAALGVTSTHLRHLVAKPDEYVEQCYAEFLANGVPSTEAFSQKVKADFGKAPPESDLRKERLAFLKAAARKAADQNLAAFLPHVEEVEAVLVAGVKIGPDGAVSIRKAELAKAVALPARKACRIIEGFLTYVGPHESYNGLKYFDRVTILIPELQALRIVLEQLSSLERWPKQAGADWIAGTVLPMVRWAISAESDIEPPLDAIIRQGADDVLICSTLPWAFVEQHRKALYEQEQATWHAAQRKAEEPSHPGSDENNDAEDEAA